MRKQTSNRFIAIDFETADYYPDSACAVAMVRVEEGQIVRRDYHLIRPPRRDMVFTYIHGITWEDVAEKPSFRELWPSLQPLLQNADFFVAHNAGFDRSVLHACCEAAGFSPPKLPFKCTMKLARKQWHIYPTKLPDVCRYLDIELDHHYALSDAEACARIYMSAHELL
ncbi:MAG: 3'-5' exonuclease [Deltaproteobacteria bacterium]|nr:3'-5' exonuclease [Deltaproteobacteria bacterium]